MKNRLEIYLEKMQNGGQEVINTSSSPSFMDVDEWSVQFESPISVRGRAYLTHDHLVLHLSAQTVSRIPCSICSEKVDVGVRVPEFCHAKKIGEIKGRVYNYSMLIREAILLETPTYVECDQKCFKREELNQYLCSPHAKDRAQFPFRNLKKMGFAGLVRLYEAHRLTV